MPKIRHLAIISMNPDKLAKFYCDVFEMKEMHRTRNGGIHLTDGYLSVAILRNRADGKANGLNHFGFQVEDSDRIAARLKEWEVSGPDKRPDDRPYAELRATDPEGNTFDLSVHGFERVEYNEERRGSSEENATA